MTPHPDEQALELEQVRLQVRLGILCAKSEFCEHDSLEDCIVTRLAALLARVRLAEAELWISSEDELEGGLNEHQLCPIEVHCCYCDKKRERLASLRQAAGEGNRE